MKIHMKIFRWLLVSGALSASTVAFAETALEARVMSQPMPHGGAGGKPFLAHWSKSVYSPLSAQDNAKVVADRRRQVDECLRDPNRVKLHGNILVDPPKRWPDRVFGRRFDYYTTRNYRITYSYGWAYAVNPATCGWLNERVLATATLDSRAGQCRIDLDKRTATGVCDFALHQKAAPFLEPEEPRNAPRLSMTPAQIQAGRAAAAMETVTGEHKMIAGHDCVVSVNHAYGDVGVRSCESKAGSFRVSRIFGKEISLTLETIGPTGDERRALEAHFDAEVGEQVFVPHLRGGFKIEARKPLASFTSPSP